MADNRVVVEHGIVVFCNALTFIPILQESLRALNAISSKTLKGSNMGIALLSLEMLAHEVEYDQPMVGRGQGSLFKGTNKLIVVGVGAVVNCCIRLSGKIPVVEKRVQRYGKGGIRFDSLLVVPEKNLIASGLENGREERMMSP